MNNNEMKTALRTLNAVEMDIVTVDSINKLYKKLIEKENLSGSNSPEQRRRLDELRSAKQLLTENIDSVTTLLTNELKSEANTLFEDNHLYEAKVIYDSISKMLPWGADISEYLSGDECLQYGICCLNTGLRIRNSNSYLFSYGYGGHWVGNEWIDCRDYEAFPADWETIGRNISTLICNHPMISKGYEKSCSSAKNDLFYSVQKGILKSARDEFDSQRQLLEQLYSNSRFLSKYINNTHGFFSWDGKQFYIYDDGNDNLYPIYKVSVKSDRILMDFHKFSHFRQKKSGKLLNHVEFTVKIITDRFIQLSCTTGNIPTGYCNIACNAPIIDYKGYLQKTKFTVCPTYGGKRIAGICFNFCKLHLEENKR